MDFYTKSAELCLISEFMDTVLKQIAQSPSNSLSGAGPAAPGPL
jgi:hypothetical protein